MRKAAVASVESISHTCSQQYGSGQLKRDRLQHRTVGSYQNLCEYLECVLPEGWTVENPGVTESEEDLEAYLSAWPPEEDRMKTLEAMKRMSQGADESKERDVREEFTLDGHCGHVCVRLVKELMKKEAKLADLTSDGGAALHAGILKTYQKMGPAKSARDLFAQAPDVQWKLLNPILDKYEMLRNDFLAGSETFPKTLSDVIRSWDPTKLLAIPVYVLCYVFDGNELKDIDLESPSAETAMYSRHVVALVMDCTERKGMILDPNGKLLVGGSMEFLRLPLALLKNPTTSRGEDLQMLVGKSKARATQGDKKRRKTSEPVDSSCKK